jgi:Tol biopolymer transport system component
MATATAGPDGIYLLDDGIRAALTDCRFREDCGRDSHPSWSPAFLGSRSRVRTERAQRVQVFVVNTDGTGLQQLTSGPEWNGDPSWHPVPVERASPSPTVS